MLEESGWTVEEISEKLKIKPSIVNDWLSGSKKPTFKHIEKISKYLKRPLATFFLPEPPQKQPLPHDFRMLPEKTSSFSKQTLLAIRIARRLQSISKELLNNLNIEIKANITPTTTLENPKNVASRERINSGITIEDQKGWIDSYQAFEMWRKNIESKNIMVFQIPMPVKDVRGFTLTEIEPYVIVVNSSDLIEARIFTLLHDYGHILLNKTGACLAEPFVTNEGNDAKIEKWCNQFASAFLLPEDQVKESFLNKTEPELTERSQLNKFSRIYKISKTALLLFMLKRNYISEKTYQNLMNAFKSTKKRAGGRAEAPLKKCIREKGRKFITLVSKNLDKGYINNNEALDYLSIKLKDLKELTL